MTTSRIRKPGDSQPADPEVVLPRPAPGLGIIVCAAVILCGAAVMVLELIGTRVLAPIFGNSLYVWTSLIAVALVSLTCGYPLGGAIADRWPRPRTFFELIALAGILTLGTLLLRGPVLAAAADWGPAAARWVLD